MAVKSQRNDQSREASWRLAPIWLMRTKPSIAEVLGNARLASRMTSGMASTGQDTPTVKKRGRLAAMNRSTAVSRRLNHRLTNWARKLTDKTKGMAIANKSSGLPKVEKP